MASYSYCMASYGGSCCCNPKKTKNNLKVLVGVTASVATIKLAELVNLLYSVPSVEEVAVIPTEKSEKFFDPEEISNIGSNHDKANVKIWRDEDEWSMWNGRGDPVLHIELGKWADAMILAPLDANTMAKIAHGLCDNLLTCVLRAWDLKNIKTKPVFFCPAMNTKMWEHPVTSEQIQILENFGYTCVPPIEKTLMCGDTGIGAMASVETIVNSFGNYMNEMCTCCGTTAEDDTSVSETDLFSSDCANRTQSYSPNSSACSSKRNSSFERKISTFLQNKRGSDADQRNYNKSSANKLSEVICFIDSGNNDYSNPTGEKMADMRQMNNPATVGRRSSKDTNMENRNVGRGNFNKNLENKLSEVICFIDSGNSDYSNPTEVEKADMRQMSNPATLGGRSLEDTNRENRDVGRGNASKFAGHANSNNQNSSSLTENEKAKKHQLPNSASSVSNAAERKNHGGSMPKTASYTNSISQSYSRLSEEERAKMHQLNNPAAFGRRGSKDGDRENYGVSGGNASKFASYRNSSNQDYSNLTAEERAKIHQLSDPASFANTSGGKNHGGSTSEFASYTHSNSQDYLNSTAKGRANIHQLSKPAPAPSASKVEGKNHGGNTSEFASYTNSNIQDYSKLTEEEGARKTDSRVQEDNAASNVRASASYVIASTTNPTTTSSPTSTSPTRTGNQGSSDYSNTAGLSMISQMTNSMVGLSSNKNKQFHVDSRDVNMSEFAKNIKPDGTSTRKNSDDSNNGKKKSSKK